MISTLTAAVSGPGMMAHLNEFARWTKLSGTRDELESLRYVQARMDEYGYRTMLLMHDAYIGLPGKARVEVDGKPLNSITHSLSVASPPGGVSGALVYVGEGTPADYAGKDVRGCIVLVEGIANPAATRNASRHGAAGQLHISPHEHLHEMCVSPVWGSPGVETAEEMPKTVVCTVSQADGAALRDRLARGEKPKVVLHAEVDLGWRKTPILVAELDPPGAGADAPFVLYSGHHDTWYLGVMDNGAANATMMEVARLCAKERARWKRGLRLCFWSGHSHGRYSGSAWYADEYWNDLEQRCVVHVNVDSTGGVGATELHNSAAMSELRPLAADAIGTQTGVTYVGKRKARSSDDSFGGIGLPAMFGSVSEQPPGPVKMRNSLGWWWHTPHDTLDKIDEKNLVRDTKIFVHVLWRLLSEPVVPLDYAEHARDLQAEFAKIAKGLGDKLDVSAMLAAAEALHGKASALAARAGKGVSDAQAARANRSLMAASRALVPLDYTRGDRFAHDPALPQPALPSLQPLRQLAAAAAGTHEAHLLTVSARRARNRAVHALRQANAALDEAIAALG
ncbi:MAG: M28 family peptidase [Alphaproteobacteria bacterium]|nr:M28 family peptidase [Alphaproteobacteria bacterium]